MSASFWFPLFAGMLLSAIANLCHDFAVRRVTTSLRDTLAELERVDPELAKRLNQDFADTPAKLRFFVGRSLRAQARRAMWRSRQESEPDPGEEGCTPAAAPHFSTGRAPVPVPDYATVVSTAHPPSPPQNTAALLIAEAPVTTVAAATVSTGTTPATGATAATTATVAPTSATGAAQSVVAAPARRAEVPVRRHRVVLRLIDVLNLIAVWIGGELGEAAAEAVSAVSVDRPFVGLFHAATNVVGVLRDRAGAALSRLNLNLVDLGYRGADLVICSPVLSGIATGTVVAVPLSAIFVCFGFALTAGWTAPAVIGAEYLRRTATRRWQTRFWRPGRDGPGHNTG